MRGDHPAHAGVNYLDYVEDLIGHQLAADNATIVGRMSHQRLAELREKNLAAGLEPYQQHWSEQSFPRPSPEEADGAWLNSMLEVARSAPTPYLRAPRDPGVFRPILHGRIHRAADAFGGDMTYVFREGDPGVRLVALKRYLLYAHRIVLPDPLFYVNQYFSPGSIFLEDGRLALIGFLDFLYSIRTLVQSEIVTFYPQYEHSEVGGVSELVSDKGYDRWVESSAAQPATGTSARTGSR